MKLRNILATLALPLAALPAVAHAEDGAESASSAPISIDFSIAGFSDYRFRGLSLSGKDPEATAQVTVSHESGLYVSAWGSNVDTDFDGKGNDLEVDWTAGYTKELGAVTVGVGAIYYSYLDHSNLNYIEAFGSLGTAVGPATVTVGVNYAPKQDNLGGNDNTYVFIRGDMPLSKDSPVSVHGTFGYEDGAFADKKKDWLVGASYDLGSGFTATLDYIDTAHSLTPLGNATAVFSLSKAF